MMLAAMLPVSLCASAYDFVADGIAYTITSFTDLECSVVANDSSYRGDITIPETVSFNGRTLTVKSIGDKAFYQDTALTSVTIPATVTTIGWEAFYYCVNLQTITLPDGLTDIGSQAFYRCSSIESIDLPAAVSKLPMDCFHGCSNLKYMDLSNVETIGESAFSYCTNLAEVKFGDKLHSIERYAFQGCGFEEFTIPNSVTSSGSYILKGCDKLQSFTLGNGITEIYNDPISGCTNVKKFIIVDGSESLTFSKDTTYRSAPFEYVYIGRSIILRYLPSGSRYYHYYCPPFWGNTHIKTVEIGESVTDLPCYEKSPYYGFFENCTSLDSIKIQGLPTISENFAKGDTALKYVEISNKTTEIKDDAFSGCSSLETIVLKALTPPTYEDGFTSSVYLNCRLLIPEGTEALYKNASPWNNFWNLAESPEAGIGEVISESATISVSAENNTIVITGKPAEQIVNVYDIQGRLIVTTTQDVIKNLSSGFYIVSVAGKTFKITI